MAFVDGNFEATVVNNELPVVLDFWAPWCVPCKAIAPVLEELADQYDGKVVVGKLNVDDNPQTATQFGIRGIPTLLVFEGGQVVDQVVGALPKPKLQSLFDRRAGA